MEFLNHPTRHLFFTGKGGVGKTSVACAVAVWLSDQGKRVLLVSTDPASNLDEVLGTRLERQPTPILSIPHLFAMNLDPEQAAADYREKMIGPYRTLLPAAAITSMEEQLSGSCTLEIAAFDEFSRLLGDASATAPFDHVLFDTAPTGHTLRLLTLPSAWTGFMEKNSTGTSCLGPLAGLQAQQALYQQTVKALSDEVQTTLVLVTRAEHAAFREAARTSNELQALGVSNQHLVINAVFRATDHLDPYAMAMQSRCDNALREMPLPLQQLPRTVLPMTVGGLLGAASLRRLISHSENHEHQTSTPPLTHKAAEEHTTAPTSLPPLSSLMDDIAAPGHGVILAMGKGGVGKTTVAAAIAVALADRGFDVLLSTTDPAAHIAAAVAGENRANLTVSRIDPAAETAKYSQEVLRTAGAGLDAAGRALLEEDLRSPCTEEIAVFRAFAEAVAQGTRRFVVLDTAPTGHTVLLLDSALAYHREVTRQASGMPESVEHLLPRLRDPELTRVLIVALPEATPVHEAAQLQRDLRRAGINPFAWVINQCFTPLQVSDPLLVQRRMQEARYLAEVTQEYSQRTAMIAWQRNAPVGPSALRQVMTFESLTSEHGTIKHEHTLTQGKIMTHTLHPELQSYVTSRLNEASLISDERKAELRQLSGYVTQCRQQNRPARLTFVCTHNSRRSHLTQIWAQVGATVFGLDHVQTFSGGTEVTACNPRTVAALQRAGLVITTPDASVSNPLYSVSWSKECSPLVCFSKVFNQSPNPVSDYCAIMTCSHADQHCPVAIGCDLRLAIRYEDPKISDDTPQEAATYDERCRQIARKMLFAMSNAKTSVRE